MMQCRSSNTYSPLVTVTDENLSVTLTHSVDLASETAGGAGEMKRLAEKHVIESLSPGVES